MRRLLKLGLFSLASYALFYFCHKQTAGFQITKIYSWLAPDSRWDLPHTKEEIANLQTIFSTPFHFLGKGGQAYAFSSQDGSVVLKLFKMHNLRQYPLAYRLSLPFPFESFRLKSLLQQRNKLERMFLSSFIAYHSLSDESALLALNLNPNPSLKSLTVTLIDKLGIAHKISLDQIPFALQKKGERAVTRLARCIEQKDLRGGKEIIQKIISHLKARHEKGLGDLDPCVRRNFGILVDGTPFFIDIGGFVPRDTDSLLSLAKETSSLHEWLSNRSFELTSYLEEIISK